MNLIVSLYVYLIIVFISTSITKNKKTLVLMLLSGTIIPFIIYFILENQNHLIFDKFNFLTYMFLVFVQSTLLFLFFYIRCNFFSFFSFIEKLERKDFFFIIILAIILQIFYINLFFVYNGEIEKYIYFLHFFYLAFLLSGISILLSLSICLFLFFCLSVIYKVHIYNMLKINLLDLLNKNLPEQNYCFFKKSILEVYYEENIILFKKNKFSIKINTNLNTEEIYKLINKQIDFFYLFRKIKITELLINSFDIGISKEIPNHIRFRSLLDYIDINKDDLKSNIDNIISLIELEDY